MRRVGLLLLVLFLVNLPFVHETLTERRIAAQGREVTATVLAVRRVGDDAFVDYRLPREVDPGRTRYAAQVDEPTYTAARDTRELLVEVVPGQPNVNRPDGAVDSPLFVVVAVLGDVVLALVALVWWRRRRRWTRHQVVGVEDGEVTLRSGPRTLTAAAPREWTGSVTTGAWVSGRYHLVAEEDVVADLPLDGLERVRGATYVVRGRVADARAGRVEVELEDGFRLRVETGPHRIRADLRDSTEVRGLLCFTPRRA